MRRKILVSQQLFSMFFDKNKYMIYFIKKVFLIQILLKMSFIYFLFLKKKVNYTYIHKIILSKWNEIDKNELVEFILPIEILRLYKKLI